MDAALMVDLTNQLDPDIATALAARPVPMTMNADGVLVVDVPTVDFPLTPGVVREEHSIPGDPEVAVIVHRRAEQQANVPGLVWMHGGGYVFGSAATSTLRLEAIVAEVGCVAVSVDYRLAPQASYPGPLDDCFNVLAHVATKGDELGIDSSRLVVGGVSAGGGLAAGVALRARDHGIPVLHQHLIYPMLDDRLVTPSSRWTAPTWTPEMNLYGWRAYLGELHGKAEVPAYAAPARAEDLSGLPPAYIHVGSLDIFVHENIDYASRLLAAGVATELHVFPGAPHGFEALAPASVPGQSAERLSRQALTTFLTP
jgi:acetyl esterase/lipase